jgi:hypothetical protein
MEDNWLEGEKGRWMSGLLDMSVNRLVEGLIDGGMVEWVVGWKMSVWREGRMDG